MQKDKKLSQIAKNIEEKYKKLKENIQIDKDIFMQNTDTFSWQEPFTNKINAIIPDIKNKTILEDYKKEKAKFSENSPYVERFAKYRENTKDSTLSNYTKQLGNYLQPQKEESSLLSSALASVSVSSPSPQMLESIQHSMHNRMEFQKIEKNIQSSVSAKEENKKLENKEMSNNSKQLLNEKSIIQQIQERNKDEVYNCKTLVNCLNSGVIQK